MFLKKLLSIASKNETLVHTTPNYKIYVTTYEGKAASKLVFASSVAPYEFLRKLRHENIIHPYKINLAKKSITTSYLTPFSCVYQQGTSEFNKHCCYKLALAVDFLHRKYNVEHRNLVLDSLFISEEGKIILGGFEKCGAGGDSDSFMFSNLVKKLTGEDLAMDSFIDNEEYTRGLFSQLEITFFGFRSFSEGEKRAFVREMLINKSEFIEIYKRRLIALLSDDLEGEASKEYKLEIVDFTLKIDVESMNEIVVILFSVLDTHVRLYLLKNAKYFTQKVSDLNEVASSLILGIKCKDFELKKATLLFIKNYVILFSSKSITKILEVMHTHITADEDIRIVCSFLVELSNRLKNTDLIYKILCKYLITSRQKNVVLDALEVFYANFDKHNVCSELLPLICGYLGDEGAQEKAFLLVDKIIHDLKEHKREIISKNWSVKGFLSKANLLRSKELTPTTEDSNVLMSPMIAEGYLEDQEADGWDDNWD